MKVPTKVPRKSFQEKGEIPIISQEADFINGYWDDESDAIRVSNPVVVFGDHTQVLKLIDFDFVVGADGVKILKPKEFLNAAFLRFFLEANPVPSLGYARHFRHISGLEIPLPPLEQQKRIVAVLDQAFAALDRARAHAEANLADAANLFESWSTAAFKFGAEQWPTKKLPDISENLDRLRVPITKKDRQAGDVPYYGASGVVDHVAKHIFNEDLLLISEDGANLLARTYPIAFSISGKSWVNNHAHVLRFGDTDTQEFVRLYLNSISIEPWVSGMAQPKLNQKALSKMPIPYPAESDRKRIVAEAESIWTASEAAKANYRAQIGDIADLRQSLLQKAFSGQLN
ncbi:restriction endonuclease subunit S [Roseovarius sp.]|uniref:restriction endonuclease subunit S n=1 Tax=Roseovarius sp. TaxID=1486281 RepID=UPI00356A6CCF